MHRWKDNDNMDLTEKIWEDVGWIHLAQDWILWYAVVNTAIKLRVP
jgi:hypothetical protein